MPAAVLEAAAEVAATGAAGGAWAAGPPGLWPLLASAVVSVAMLFAASRNLARQDF